MNNGKSITELAIELERRNSTSVDYVADTRDMLMTADTNELFIDKINDSSMGINDHGHDQIAYRTDIPKKYYRKMHTESPDLLSRNVNHWFQTNDKRRMVRTQDGDVRAFLSDRYKRIDNMQIAEAALPALLDNRSQFEVISSEITDSRLYIQARLPKIQGDVKLNDPVQAGLIISNSEVGLGAIDIKPMIYRLVCLNGMVTGKVMNDGRMRRTHLGSQVTAGNDGIIFKDDTAEATDHALMLQIRDTIHQLSDPDLFMKLMEQMKQAAEGSTIQNPVQAVEVLSKAYNLSEKENHSILESLIKGQDYSRWGMLNAVTEQANNHNNYDRAVEFEQAGGSILNMRQSQWRTIAEAA